MAASVFERLVTVLDEQSAQYRVLRHEAVYTSEEAARARGTTLASGAKALICKAGDRFLMFVLPADRRLANKRARKTAGARNLAFANRDQVLELTGLTPGSIPPFGSLFGLTTWCDARLADQGTINFNAGDHTISLSMPYAEYERVERPRIGAFSD
jgi:Ala-tRNA(Pro) deacylase